MTAPAPPRIIADVGGLAVVEHGSVVLLVDRGTGPWATVAFVLAVLALVFGGFGAVALALPGMAVPWWLGTVFLVVGLAFVGATFGVIRRIRAAKARPVSTLRPVVILDRARRLMLDADGTLLAPLDQVRFERRTQLASSSPSLIAVTPHGTLTLLRGNPFHGGIGNLDAVLTSINGSR